jgi:hypothetical protein
LQLLSLKTTAMRNNTSNTYLDYLSCC